MREWEKRAKMMAMKENRLAAFLALALFATGILGAQGQAARFESDSRLDAEIFETPQINAQKLARAALLASGSDEAQVERHLKRLDALWAELSPELKGSGQEEEDADKILSFMYKRIFRKYVFEQTRVDQAMDTGVYNCVSSALIFMYFCKRAGIPVQAVETPRHAFCAITTQGGEIDVETTNPYGVNPGRRREKKLGGGTTQWTTVPAKNYAGRHNVDDRRAIGMIYGNRIVQLQKKRQNAQTVGLAVDAYEVQGHSDLARSDIELCVGNAASDMIAAAKDEEAIAFLKSAEERFWPCENWTKKKRAAYHNLLLRKAKTLPCEDAFAELEANKQNLSPADFAELKEFVYLLDIQKKAQAHDWPAAVKMAQRGLEEFPQSKKLLANKNIYLQNWAAEFHNAAVDLFNAGKKDEAVAKIKEGLAILPESKILLNDLNKMQAPLK